MSMRFHGEDLCPPHIVEALREQGITLSEAMGCSHGVPA